jgi:signal transduction histidine kinase
MVDLRSGARAPAGALQRLSVVQAAGALVCTAGIISLFATIGRDAPPSMTWADAGISALVGVAFVSLAADTGARVYAGTSGWVAEVTGWPSWLLGAVVLLLAPVAGAGVAVYGLASLLAVLRAPVRPPRAVDWRASLGIGLLGLAWVLAIRAAGVRIGDDNEIYSTLLIGAGLSLFWGAAGGRLAGVTDRERYDNWLRTLLGLLLTLGGVVLVLSSTGLFHQAQRTIAGTAIALSVLVLVVGPRWRRTSRLLFEERAARERAQERAELAGHLHDSVLQTLALIQRRSDDVAEVASLARRQERELRDWLLATPDEAPPTGLLSGALRAAAAEVEDAERARIEVVTVGDTPLTEPLAALVAAAREALTNAVRHGSPPVSLFCRVGDREVNIYVHDRGPGFNLDEIEPDRRGVRESIIARTTRHGGTAAIRVTADAGCEIALTMKRR